MNTQFSNYSMPTIYLSKNTGEEQALVLKEGPSPETAAAGLSRSNWFHAD
jgi:hypothetical protein